MIALAPQNEPPLRRVWWLEPAWLFAVVVGGTMLAAWAQTDAAFQLYGAPKFITGKHMLLALAIIFVFAVGRQLAEATGRVPDSTTSAVDGTVRFWFWVSTGLALFGYAVWLAVGVRNGFTLNTLHEFLTTDDPHFTVRTRDDMFYTVRGVTTCTQFGIAAVLLGTWLYLRGERLLLWPMALLIALAALRSLLFSERIALIELLVPVLVIVLRMRVLGSVFRPVARWALQLAPLLGVVGLLLIFGGFEYFRSWRFYHDDFDSYTEFTIWRVSGYYTTAHNNGVMALETQPIYPLPYATLLSAWSLPGLAKTPLSYPKLTGLDPEAQHLQMLEHYATPELNNVGGLFQPALDFGLAGLLVFWFACGFISGRLYRGYLVGNLAGLMLYPLVFIAILETPRFLYLCYPRSVPPIVMLLLVGYITARARVPLLARPAVPDSVSHSPASA